MAAGEESFPGSGKTQGDGAGAEGGCRAGQGSRGRGNARRGAGWTPGCGQGRRLTAHLWELPHEREGCQHEVGLMGQGEGGKDAVRGPTGLSPDREAGLPEPDWVVPSPEVRCAEPVHTATSGVQGSGFGAWIPTSCES